MLLLWVLALNWSSVGSVFWNSCCAVRLHQSHDLISPEPTLQNKSSLPCRDYNCGARQESSRTNTASPSICSDSTYRFRYYTEQAVVYADEFRIPSGWDGSVYEIPVIKLMIVLALAIYGSFIDVIFSVATCTVKFFPLILASNKGVLDLAQSVPTHWLLFAFLCWIRLLFAFLGWIAVNALLSLVFVALVFYGLASGQRCAREAMRSYSIPSGSRSAWSRGTVEPARNGRKDYSRHPRNGERVEHTP